jgi:hypothetical protein
VRASNLAIRLSLSSLVSNPTPFLLALVRTADLPAGSFVLFALNSERTLPLTRFDCFFMQAEDTPTVNRTQHIYGDYAIRLLSSCFNPHHCGCSLIKTHRVNRFPTAKGTNSTPNTVDKALKARQPVQ